MNPKGKQQSGFTIARRGENIRPPTRIEISNDSSKQAGNRKSREGEVYGFIVSTKLGFGFIQPFIDEEQIYFRDVVGSMKIGDKVGYVSRSGPRGLCAEGLRLLSGTESTITKMKGVISRLSDRHRSSYGSITLDFSSLDSAHSTALQAAGVKEVVFIPTDVVLASLPKNHRIDKGDFVEFSLSQVEDSGLYIAKNVTLLQLKRDRAIAVHIQRLLEAGAVRELGVVSALKKTEYGFIKALDRKEEIYFRLEDGNDDSATSEKLSEGSEVEFFAISECVKGKMSDRAIHVRPVPKGTVKFELLLASSVRAVVIAETGTRPEESPGLARLEVPVSIPTITAANSQMKLPASNAAVSTVSRIDLWQRCLPEDMICKVGDVLQLDVHYYRPEKLFFARSVKIAQYRSLGREQGFVNTIKEQHSFGFIHSSLRNTDVYFKSTQVIDAKGNPVHESSIKVGLAVSFEVLFDGSGKLRARRVMLLHDETAAAINDSSVTTAADAIVSSKVDDKYVLMKDVLGVIVRNSTKKESPGLVKLCHEHQIKEMQNIVFYDPELVSALKEFQQTVELDSVSVIGLHSTAILKNYYHVIEGMFTGIAHEVSHTDANDPSSGKTLKMYKIKNPDEYAVWRSKNSKTAHSPIVLTDAEDASPVAVTTFSNSNSSVVASGLVSVQYLKDDYITPEYGPLTNDLTVLFDLYWDKSKFKPVAKCVRLTDEAVDSDNKEQVGVIDVIVDKHSIDKYGFIRCIPSDEKLFWYHTSYSGVASQQQQSNSSEKQQQQQQCGLPLMMGSEVGFQLRRRGGLRCAANIRVLTPGTVVQEELLDGLCSAIVVDNQHVVILDASHCALLNKKYMDLRVISEANISKEGGKSWDKKSLLAATSSPNGGNNSRKQLAVTDSDSNISGRKAAASIDATTTASHDDSEITAAVTTMNLSVKSNSNASEDSNTDGNISPVVSTADSNNGSNSNTTTTASLEFNYKAKYFPTLPRAPVPINKSEDSNSNAAVSYVVGDVVICRVTAKWAMQRSPLHVTIVSNNNNTSKQSKDVTSVMLSDSSSSSSLNTTAVAFKRRGRVTRVKYRVKSTTTAINANNQSSSSNEEYVDAATMQCYDLANASFVEIHDLNECAKEQDTMQQAAKQQPLFHGHFYYCETREVHLRNSSSCTTTNNNNRNNNNNGKESKELSVQIGDEVDFWAVPALGSTAFHVTVLPKIMSATEIQFGKRAAAATTITSASTAAASAVTAAESRPKISPLNLITMALGPPNDTAPGFVAGWRSARMTTTIAEDNEGSSANDNVVSSAPPTAAEIVLLPWAHLLTHMMK